MRPFPATVAWRDDALEVLDQRQLPATETVLRLTTLTDVIDAIATLAVRGAPAIGAAGGFGVVVGLDEGLALEEVATRLSAARPTAVNLSWAVRRVAAVAEAEGRDAALAEAGAVRAEDEAACAAIGRHGADLLASLPRVDSEPLSVMTHCNAGRLATCGIGTALGPLYTLHEDGVALRVITPETRPLLQGARLSAWELDRAGVDVRVAVDGAGAGLILGGHIDAVIVGADRIAANGDVANKVGTLAHALAASRAGIPLLVAAPTSTLDAATADGASIEIEQRGAGEVTAWRDHQSAPEGVGAVNPAFDVTPADLVTAIITERGLLHPPYGAAIAAALAG